MLQVRLIKKREKEKREEVRKTKRTYIFLALLLCALLLCGCGAAPAGGRELVIAVTGDREVYDYDPSILNAVDLAVDECNALYAGDGWQVSWETTDDDSVYDRGVTQAAALARRDDVTAILGTHSFSIVDLAAELASQNGKLYVAFNGCNDGVTAGGYGKVFANVYGAQQSGAAMGRYAAGQTAIRRVAVYSSTVSYEQNWVRAFCRELGAGGARVVDCVGTATDYEEFRVTAERWKLLGVDTVLVLEYYADDAYNAAEWLRELLPGVRLLGDSSFDYEARLHESAQAVEGLVIPDVLPLEAANATEQFTERYLERYGEEPSRWATHAYDTVRMVADTAVAAGSADPAKIAAALHGEEGYTGVCGTVRFDAGGALEGGGQRLLVCRDGVFTELTREEETTDAEW